MIALSRAPSYKVLVECAHGAVTPRILIDLLHIAIERPEVGGSLGTWKGNSSAGGEDDIP